MKKLKRIERKKSAIVVLVKEEVLVLVGGVEFCFVRVRIQGNRNGDGRRREDIEFEL